MKKLFNNGWEFKKTDVDLPFGQVRGQVGGDGWTRVDIPHDWLIHQTKDLYETSAGWYRKSFTVNGEAVRLVRFEGVYMDTAVWVNGKPAGEWKYGYSTFEFDITSLLNEGKNEIIVKVSHRSPNTRWYSGAGIFRNVWLLEHRGAYLKSDGVYFSEKQDEQNGNVRNIKLSAESVGGDTVEYVISDTEGKILLSAKGKPNEEIAVTAENPKLWDIASPNLYTLETKLYESGNVTDSQSCKVGFRTIEFKADSGFWLNGKNVKLNGVCLHHDLGALGAAVNRTALRRQLSSMKEMGANAVRTSHNMPAVELMELCDEMGILVDSEAFDMWELKKTDYDYARFFDEWYVRDVASWVRRDRNHPSVIMWSVGNEIYDTHVSPRGVEVTKMLCTEVRKHDYNRNAYTTIGSNYIEWEGAQNCAMEIDTVGYNYGERLYEEHHRRHPEWLIYGSETAARVQSRGVYHFPKSAAYITHDDLQCSCLENCRAGISERTAQTSIIDDRDTPFCAGQFIWTGSDYIGEPSPYSTKNAYYGQIDTAGFRKDSYYLYQAAWTDKTVLHLMPYWDFNEGQLIDVMVYTNQPYAELFFNGKSLGKKAIEGIYSADWQLPYSKGELRAVSYDKDGNVTAEDSVKSFGDTAEIRLTPDKTVLKADGEDMIFLDISAYDAEGILVANARNRVAVEVSGAGRLVGLDSGDSTDYDEYKSTSKKLFGGKLLAMIMGKDRGGEISVKVTSEGLPDASLTLSAEEAFFDEGMADAFEENRPIGTMKEVPVRKIELSVSAQHFSKDVTEAEATAVVLPENAEYGVEWGAVTDTGVVTNIAAAEGDGCKAKVKAYGDGKFRLRCYCRNGKPDPEVISELEMDVQGLGSVVIDPYTALVRGSLYNMSPTQLDEVSEGGVKIARGSGNIVGFRNVDFGRAGSDSFSVTLINWHNDDEVKFSLWSGMPGEDGSEKLGDFVYRADFIWQTYIPNSFKLDRHIKGVKDLCFEFEDSDKRIYFGGFLFEGGDESYSEICAAEFSNIRGDSFKTAENAVENIGNNVFIDYDGFDFSEGVTSVTVKGRTRNANDSVHMRIIGESGEVKEILEFPRSEDYMEKTFAVRVPAGKADVKFDFLPGCDFDFVSFKFNA
ncbi:MAG: DUF4982 domain-containing protein [Oscillospiraceae bacterium]|nr:DUF4982 domain-containing protein [Oscillospiraceae bacterium]